MSVAEMITLGLGLAVVFLACFACLKAEAYNPYDLCYVSTLEECPLCDDEPYKEHAHNAYCDKCLCDIQPCEDDTAHAAHEYEDLDYGGDDTVCPGIPREALPPPDIPRAIVHSLGDS